MRYWNLFVFICCTAVFASSCGAGDPCETLDCVNGDCIDGSCDCETGWEGELCDKESRPRQILITKMTLKKFPVDDLGDAWDKEDDGSNADVTILVKSLSGTLFEPTDIVNQVHEDADGSQAYEIDCSVKITDLDEEIVFEIVDYDFDDNFNVVFQFMNSLKTVFNDKYENFPTSISLSSSTGKAQIDLEVSYSF